MKKRLCSIFFIAIFLCNLLAACSPASSAPSGSNQIIGSNKSRISVSLDNMSTSYYRTGSGDRIYTSSGWKWDYDYYYQLVINLTVKNIELSPAQITATNFTASWDGILLQNPSMKVNGSYTSATTLATGVSSTIHLVYDISNEQYSDWTKSGHNILLTVNYGDQKLYYLHVTNSESYNSPDFSDSMPKLPDSDTSSDVPTTDDSTECLSFYLSEIEKNCYDNDCILSIGYSITNTGKSSITLLSKNFYTAIDSYPLSSISYFTMNDISSNKIILKPSDTVRIRIIYQLNAQQYNSLAEQGHILDFGIVSNDYKAYYSYSNSSKTVTSTSSSSNITIIPTSYSSLLFKNIQRQQRSAS